MGLGFLPCRAQGHGPFPSPIAVLRGRAGELNQAAGGISEPQSVIPVRPSGFFSYLAFNSAKVTPPRLKSMRWHEPAG